MTRFKHRPPYKKELLAIIGIVAVFGWLILGLFGPGGYRSLQKSRLEQKRQQMAVRALELDNSRLLQKITALRTDPMAQEGKARENNFARENEVILPVPE
ncbi:MAG: septum formation initiator family protein [Acidobacteriota bacterium]|nr:septum formation initiator family protein [Acidobacteriota bacterium]